MVHQDGSYVNADCKSKAVKIRTNSTHVMWPNIARTTLLFSDIKYYFEDDLDKIGDIDSYNFYKAVKPNYG